MSVVVEQYSQDIWTTPFTLRQLSAYLISQGLPQNTTSELARLNVPAHVASADTPINDGFLLYYWAVSNTGGSCCCAPPALLRDIWTTTSGDDGATWQQPKAVITVGGSEPTGDGHVVTHSFYNVEHQDGMPAIRTREDLTLVGVQHVAVITNRGSTTPTLDSGARAALAVLNYQAVGSAQPEGGSVTFKRVGTSR